MADPTFNLPVGGPYTTTLTFRAGSLVPIVIRDSPIQFKRVAETGKVFTYTYHSNRELLITLSIVEMNELDEGAFEGLNSLRTFIITTLGNSATPFDYVDAEANIETMVYWSGVATWTEPTQQGFWSGELILRRSL